MNNWRRPFAIITIATAILGGLYGYGKTTGGGNTSGLANVWVSTTGNDTTCTRSASLIVDPSSGADCATFNKAYQILTPGDKVRVACGTYDKQAFATRTDAGPTSVFDPATAGCVTVQNTSSSGCSISFSGVHYVTIDGFIINGNQNTGLTGGYTPVCDSSSLSTFISDHVTISNNLIDVGVLNGGTPGISLHAAQNWTISGNTFGPWCCGADVPASPEGIRVGKPSGVAADCTSEACNITITGNTFQFILDHSTLWPSSGWGSSPESTCLNGVLCHLDGIHIWGIEGATITNNQFLGSECQDIFVESQNSAINSNFTIVGNTANALAIACDGFIALDATSGASQNFGGTWNVGFNESPSQLNFILQDGSFIAGTVFNFYGNYAPFLRTFRDAGGTDHGTDCTYTTGGGPPANVTINYAYNVWQSGSACAGSDTTGSTPTWVAYAAAPSVPQDMHKTGSHGTADNFVTCASVSIGAGCPTGTDVFGNTWPTVTANAGADQEARP